MHVVVTGASSGIGEAIAREWSTAGAAVTLVARRKERLEALAASLEGPSRVEVQDLSTLQTDWLADAAAELGPVDVLVNNAGVQVIAPTSKVDVEKGERSLVINLFAPLRLARAVLPSMIERKTGAIVNIASLAAIAPTPGMTYYNAGKCGLAGASEALRGELLDTGVNVVTVYPGIIGDTDMAEHGLESYEESKLVAMQPRGDSPTLARKIRSVVDRGGARLIYPEANHLARWFPGTTRWLMDRLTPPVAE